MRVGLIDREYIYEFSLYVYFGQHYWRFKIKMYKIPIKEIYLFMYLYLNKSRGGLQLANSEHLGDKNMRHAI